MREKSQGTNWKLENGNWQRYFEFPVSNFLFLSLPHKSSILDRIFGFDWPSLLSKGTSYWNH
jgi:hypothetical protein